MLYCYQSLKNHFLICDARGQSVSHTKQDFFDWWGKFAKYSCDRIEWLRVDGLLVITSTVDSAMAIVHVFNRDGSYGDFSINGARIAGAFLLKESCQNSIDFYVGSHSVSVSSDSLSPTKYSVAADSAQTIYKTAGGYFVDVGNPHFLIDEQLSREDFLVKAPARSKIAVNGQSHNVNVTFFWKNPNLNDVQAYVYERGVGWTESCGSAVLALVSLLHYNKKVTTEETVRVTMPGGSSEVSVLAGGKIIVMANVSKVNLAKVTTLATLVSLTQAAASITATV